MGLNVPTWLLLKSKNDEEMRARTYIYMLGLAALALQGCNKNTHPSTPDTEPYVISMEPAGVTRALINDIAGLQGEGFVVYGHSLHNSNAQQVFSAQAVEYVDGVWSYSPTRYWDRNATYCFGAYAPDVYPVNEVSETGIIKSVEFTLPQWQRIDGTETDVVVATSQGAATTYLDNAKGFVNLTFDHVYAQFVVRVVRSASFQNTYKLTSISYSNVPTADGTATYTLDYTTPAASAWSGVALSAASKNAYSNADGEEITSNPEDTPTAKHLVVPFAGSDEIQVTVGYIVNDRLAQTGTAKTGISQLEAGKRYVLTLSLGSGAVIEPSLDIEQWIEVQDEQDIEVEEDDKHNW